MNDNKSLDPSKMYHAIYEFPDQMETAIKIGESIALKGTYRNIENIVVAGMGGSAIGGDVARTLLKEELDIPMVVSRNYTLPNWVNKHTLVICSSYSGQTEETLSAFHDAQNKGALIIGISTGGDLTKFMNELDKDILQIPSGLQPRAALAISFIPLLYLLKEIDLIESKTISELKNAIKLIRTFSDRYGLELNENPTYQLANRIYKTIPVIYALSDSTNTIAIRWKGQLSENSKMLAYHSELPEMNHNEIVGWENNSKLIKQVSLIWLSDRDDHPRSALRQESTRKIIKDLPYLQEIISVEGASITERYLHMIHFGDWVSYWCAILHGTDPTPVKKIDRLKGILSETS